ncbi:MAG TPA: glycosyltransferase family 9 protein [Terriglobia bacterium]
MPRILVIRLSSIGDIVHTLPAVAALGQSLPQAEIGWAVESRYAELVEQNPFVRRVIGLDTLGWRRRWKSLATVKDAVGSLGKIRRFRPDFALDFQGLVKSAALARLSGATRRLGFGRPWLRESWAGSFYTEQAEAQGRTHVVEENLALVERLGVPPVPRECWQFLLPGSASADDRIGQRVAALGVRRFVVVNPGGGWISKRWAPERYAELVQEFGQDEDCAVLMTGSPSEEPMIRGILEQARAPRAHYFPSTLVEFIALARRATLFVGGDTGPLHIAAAVGTPIVAIYGPTNPVRNGPFAAEDITLRSPSFADQEQRRTHWHLGQTKATRHLQDVTVEAVREAIRRRLAAAHGA